MASSTYPSPTVWALHTVSGAVTQVSPHLLTHEHFGKYLVEVAPQTKSYDPQMWKPTTADEYNKRAKTKLTKDEDKN